MRVWLEADLSSAWEQFWRDAARDSTVASEVEHLRLNWPQKDWVLVDYADVARFDHGLAEELLEQPQRTLHFARLALGRQLMEDQQRQHGPLVRIKGLPAATSYAIKELTAEQRGRLVQVEGLVQRVVQPTQRIAVAAWMCARCGQITIVPQEERSMTEPLECEKSPGGCGRTGSSTRWDMRTAPDVGDGRPVSSFVDYQTMELIEPPESRRGGDQAESLPIDLEADLVRSARAGDRVTVVGILRAYSQMTGRRRVPREFEVRLDVLSVTTHARGFDEVRLTPEDELEMVALSRRPDLAAMLLSSIAPSILGMGDVKEAILLQLFGGVDRQLDDGTRSRGLGHILLVGDPGTAKSQLLTFVSQVAPRGVYTSGKGASGVGLTAAAVQKDGRWGLEAGALVLADHGFCCIDELEKMNESDRESIHGAMEQQIVRVAKAGIVADLYARCSVLAAANPQYGKFDAHATLPDQFDLDPALLSRFDAIYALTDHPEEARDRELATWVISGRKTHRPAIAVETLRKYLAYAKSNVQPILDEDAVELIVDFYAATRASTAEGTMAVTARQLEAVRRFAEASARSRLSKRVTRADVLRAIGIMHGWLRKVANVGGGTIDYSIITSGKSLSEHGSNKALLQIVEGLQGAAGATTAEIVAQATDQGIKEPEAMLERLYRRGELYQPTDGRYRLAAF